MRDCAAGLANSRGHSQRVKTASWGLPPGDDTSLHETYRGSGFRAIYGQKEGIKRAEVSVRNILQLAWRARAVFKGGIGEAGLDEGAKIHHHGSEDGKGRKRSKKVRVRITGKLFRRLFSGASIERAINKRVRQ